MAFKNIEQKNQVVYFVSKMLNCTELSQLACSTYGLHMVTIYSSHTALNMQNKTRSNTHRILVFFIFILIWNHIINLLALYDSSVLCIENFTLLVCLLYSLKHSYMFWPMPAFIRLTISVLKIFFSYILTWESLSQRSPTKISPLYILCRTNEFSQQKFYIFAKYNKTKKLSTFWSLMVGLFFPFL